MRKLIFTIAITMLVGGCVSLPKTTLPTNYTLTLKLTEVPPSNKYVGLDYGIRLNITDKRANAEILNRYDGGINTTKPQISTYPNVKAFVSESLKKYMQTMGFDLEADINTDYLLDIEIAQYQISYLSGTGWIGTVCLDMQIFDESNKQVYPRTTITGRATAIGSYTDMTIGNLIINEAYTNALRDIDWDKVAYFLKRAKTASEEKNKQVTGKGCTTLEHTIIRWFVDSAPKGADVLWRIVSSTPDVKNTNQTYLGSTPYESTESFDIKGLTYNNSGNVQIEITCEKAGYIIQKRRFNLRQVIEQKEISTKFNLIKEE